MKNPIDQRLTKTAKELKSNVIEKTRDLGLEISRALHVHSRQSSIQNKIVYALTFIIIAYFAIMDFLTYLHIQNMPVRYKDPLPLNGTFHYFRFLSVKGMMEDQLSSHLIWPTNELFEAATNFSQLPGITPNAVSVFGAILAIPAGKMLSMENLTVKRISIILFSFRLWIDGLDGVVFRMQRLSESEKHTQQSLRHTSGWLIDFLCDLFAALMFLVGFICTVKQSARKRQSHYAVTAGILPTVICPSFRQNSESNSPRPSSPQEKCSGG